MNSKGYPGQTSPVSQLDIGQAPPSKLARQNRYSPAIVSSPQYLSHPHQQHQQHHQLQQQHHQQRQQLQQHHQQHPQQLQRQHQQLQHHQHQHQYQHHQHQQYQHHQPQQYPSEQTRLNTYAAHQKPRSHAQRQHTRSNQVNKQVVCVPPVRSIEPIVPYNGPKMNRQQLLDYQADIMLRLKVRRFKERDDRMKRDLERPRVYASEACKTIIEFCNTTDDMLIPCPWLIESGVQKRDKNYMRGRQQESLASPTESKSKRGCCVIA